MSFGVLVAGLLALRGGLIWYLAASGVNHLQPDSTLYLLLAENLVQKGWFSASVEVFAPEVFRTPGYPAFLAGLQVVGLGGLWWVSAAQELVYLFSAFLAYRGIRSLLSEHLGRAALVFMLLEPGGLAFPKLVGSETLFIPFLLGAVFSIGFWLRNARWHWLLLAGALIGTGVLVRPAATYLPIIVLPIMRLAGRSRRTFAVGAVALLLGLSIVLGPWIARNTIHFGEPFISGQASNLLANFHVPIVWETTQGIPFEKGQALVRERVADVQRGAQEELGRALDDVDRSRLQQAWALAELSSNLPTYAVHWTFGVVKAMLGANLLELYHVANLRTERLRYHQIAETGILSKAWRFLSLQDPLVLLELLLRAIAAGLALAGAWSMLRSRDPFLWLVLGVNAYFLSIAGPMGYGRLRFPVEVLWFLQAALGLGWIRSRFGRLK
jgi:4-amino-4-deoxy-L-arabinose transferase-like glycosyltransferase